MLCAAYDILKKEAATLIWVEAAYDLESARLRVKELVDRSPDEYVIFDQRTRQIIANSNSPPGAQLDSLPQTSPKLTYDCE
jgi:hypothetical protein